LKEAQRPLPVFGAWSELALPMSCSTAALLCWC